ncbi:GntR family transcriptional regulator [Cognatiyoonia sp. IB215182]|uniref:GntR family transcriptional regulator n=1 Tax=Cognatiyoonia sp. IB215182 TaxID=3097353 RepID=UPI002A0FAF04|nr:GntR family transcriptional regulator [Cognatiyoonia sp. IB215182]MDX8352450.1 GntR family transcriptional regulator [Cognatiyoonia sp. IB215182]
MTKTSAPTSAYQQLRARILNGEIRPGERLREVELAEDLGLSRTPVREAIRRLEQDGIVEHAAHKGAVVRLLDQSSITELYTIREVLEGTAARLAAQHASETEIEALEEVLATQPPESDDLDAAEASRRNAIFHGAIGQAAHNRFLLSAMDGIASALTLLGPTTLAMKGRIDAARTEHQAILSAIAARDADAAEEAARAHIRAAHRARLRLIYDVA